MMFLKMSLNESSWDILHKYEYKNDLDLMA